MAGKADAPRFFARRPFVYAGTDLDRGQVFTTVGAINDEKLERLGYMAPLDGRPTLYTCAECGVEFVGEPERRGHGDKRHSGRTLSPLEEDQRAEREARMLEQVAPLHLDRTAAALAG
jgi:hypothetical protein